MGSTENRWSSQEIDELVHYFVDAVKHVAVHSGRVVAKLRVWNYFVYMQQEYGWDIPSREEINGIFTFIDHVAV